MSIRRCSSSCRKKVCIHPVAVVQRRVGVVVDAAPLRAEANAANETLERDDTFLQVHDSDAALVIGFEQRFAILDRSNANPGTTVIGLHEKGIADLVANVAEIKQLRVTFERRLQIGRFRVRFGRYHPGFRHRHAEPHHRAIRRLLLHGLQRPGIVEHVKVVSNDGFLNPLARRVVPVRQTVDDDIVFAVLRQAERFNCHALDFEFQRVIAKRDRQVEFL